MPTKQSTDVTDLDDLIDRILTDAYGDAEQLSAFCTVFEDEIVLPGAAEVIGERVSVIEFDFDGDERHGVTATILRESGADYTVAATELVFPATSNAARYIAAYRKWLGLKPYPSNSGAGQESASKPRKKPKNDASKPGIDPHSRLDLVVLSVKESVARTRVLGTDQIMTFRAKRLRDLVPGEIATVKPNKQWSYAGHPYLSGEIESTRLDVAALGLKPLKLDRLALWDPKKHYWGEPGEPIENWAKPIIARGPRPYFEMEQILPGEDPEDPLEDPIIEAVDLNNDGDYLEARRILMDLCAADLRCLDAHAHLGIFILDRRPEDAIRHYEAGLRIGELSLGENFDGMLPWSCLDNRPFLRCMEGYGSCLWRLGRFEEAKKVFDRMLWLNPTDNQSVRFLISRVQASKPWKRDKS